MGVLNVSAIIVTRGDVDLGQVVASLPVEWEVLVWNNGEGINLEGGLYKRVTDGGLLARRVLGDGVHRNLSVYGRYAAIEYASNELIYVQDDDCLVSDPAAFPRLWELAGSYPWDGRTDEPWGSDPRDFTDHIVCNMPAAFRARHFYDEHALVGFGAVFHRSLPATTWGRLTAAVGDAGFPTDWAYEPNFLRTCDIPFTFFNARVLVDIEYEDMPWASADNRMWKQPDHQGSRQRMLDLCREARNAVA